jgi:hypothetical protein
MTNDHGLLVLLARIIAGNLRTAGAVCVCEPGRDMKVDGYGMSERIMQMVDDKPPARHGALRTTVLSPDERKEIWHRIEQTKLRREGGVSDPGPVMNLEQAEILMRATER